MFLHRRLHPHLVLAWTALILLQSDRAVAQIPSQSSSKPGLSASDIVDRMTERNAERSRALERYQNRRSYRLEYAGFPETIHAEMVVDVSYAAPDTKKFTLISQSGSKWIINHVFKRLLDSEREAMDTENRVRSALNKQNYDFTMLAERSPGEDCGYVLGVQPKQPSKFLYRGRIWVNAQDFAVCRIEAEPAQNPSFWIKKTEIRHTYVKEGDFWLPSENNSVSTMRLGGRATLTIKYGDYKIESARPLNETDSKSSSATSSRPKPVN
jgi:hypothetical protein